MRTARISWRAICNAWGMRRASSTSEPNPALLHLKSGIAYLGGGVWVADAAIRDELGALHGLDGAREPIVVAPAEGYAANCVRVNEAVLVPEGYPQMSAALTRRGCRVVRLDMSEFRKMDGGLSCLSLRF